MIYGNQHDLTWLDLEAIGNHNVWLAEFDVPRPTAQLDFVMWQYTSSGTVAGVPGAVDMNLLFETQGT